MKKKLLTKQILLALAMSAAAGTTGMAENITEPIRDDSHNGSYSENVTVTNGNATDASIHLENAGEKYISIVTENGAPEGFDIILDSQGSGIRTQGSTGNVTLDSSGNNEIYFGDGGNGITTSDDVNITLTAAGDNVIKSSHHIGETGENGGDGINSADGGSGSVTLTAGGSNKITVSSDGISASDGKDHTYTAQTGNNEITAGNNGVNQEGTGTITLTAENGSNSITTENGDGIRVDGTGTVTLSAQTNTIKAGDNGIQVSDGTSVINGQKNDISGLNGLDVSSGGLSIIMAQEGEALNHIIGNGTETNPQIGINGYGIHTSGENTTAIVIGQTNTIEGEYTGLLATTGSSSVIYGQTDNVITGKTHNGADTSDSIMYIIAENGSNQISGGSIGAQSQMNGELYIKARGDNSITGTKGTGLALAENGKANIVSAEGSNIIHGDLTAISLGGNNLSETANLIQAHVDNQMTAETSNVLNVVSGTLEVIAETGSNIIQGGYSGVVVSPSDPDTKNGHVILTANQGENRIVDSKGNGAYTNNYSLIEMNALQNQISAQNGAYAMANSQISIAATGNGNFITATSYGVIADTEAIVSLNANNGENSIVSSGYGILAQYTGGSVSGKNSEVHLTALNNFVNAGTYGARVNSDSFLAMTANEGNNEIQAGQHGIYTVNSGYAGLSAKQANIVSGKNTGLIANNGTISLVAGTDNQIESAQIGLRSYTNADISLTADGNNLITAGTVDSTGFGTGKAISAESQGAVTLSANQGSNSLSGAVYAIGQQTEDDTDTAVSLTGAANAVYSATTIADAGDLNQDTSFDGKSVISALYAEDGATITVDGSHNELYTLADPKNESQLERTIWAYNGADIIVNGESNISTNQYEISPNSLDVAIAAGTATGLEELGAEAIQNFDGDRATVNVNYDGESHITGDILAAYAGQVDITANDVNTRATGTTPSLHVQGNLLAGNNGVLNLDLGNGGTLTGRADDYGDANEEHTKFFNPAFSSTILSGGEVSLNIGNGASWNVTGQSWITNLTGEGGVVNMTGTEDASSHAVHIKNLSGNHTFVMDVNHANHTASDMLYVANTDENSVQTVQFTNMANLAGMVNGEKLRFATVNAANTQLQFVSGDTGTARTYARDIGINDLGLDIRNEAYQTTDTENVGYNGESFGMDKAGNESINGQYGDGTNWYLVRNESADQTSDAGKTVIAMSKVNYSNAVYMDRLNKRMGEARYIEGGDGLWVRLRHDRIGKDDAFRSMNTMFELGYDWHAKGQQDGEHRQGVAFDYMRGTADYKNVAGDGDVRRAGVWLYDTWLGDKGHYSDYVVKYGRLSNDFDIYGRTSGEKISGDYDNDVWSVSAEYGRKKDIGNEWYFEPQVQAQYAYVTSADYTTSQGTKVSLDGIDSLIGRAGFRLGRDTSEGNTVYFKADILHEFLGDQSIRATDITGTLDTTYENEGTWYDVGFGFSHRMGEDSYMFLDVEHSFGNDNDDTYQVNIGLNHAF